MAGAWQQALTRFLEGLTPRAELDAALASASLSDDELLEVAATLTLTDRLSEGLDATTPGGGPPAALREQLSALPPPTELPCWADEPAAGDPAAGVPATEKRRWVENVLVRFLEGRGGRTELEALLAGAELDDDLRLDIEDAIGLAGELDMAFAAEPPAGALERTLAAVHAAPLPEGPLQLDAGLPTAAPEERERVRGNVIELPRAVREAATSVPDVLAADRDAERAHFERNTMEDAGDEAGDSPDEEA